MSRPSDLDPLAVRLQFGRRAARLAQADFLLREVERRMLDRLDVVRMSPAVVLDVGTGLRTGRRGAVEQRYPSAKVLGMDVAVPLAAQAARMYGAVARSGLAGRLKEIGSAPRSGPGPARRCTSPPTRPACPSRLPAST